MEQEFKEAYDLIFEYRFEILMKCLKYKMEAMGKCEDQKEQFD